MDPYVKFSYDGITYKSKTDKGGGKTPIWNETFIVHIRKMEEAVKF